MAFDAETWRWLKMPHIERVARLISIAFRGSEDHWKEYLWDAYLQMPEEA